MTEPLIEYRFFNLDFNYFLYFQRYFQTRYNDQVRQYEHIEYTQFFKRVLKQVPKDKLIIDIGANSGLFCIPLCLYGYQVLGFEPVKSSLECLQLGIKSNNLSNLKLYPYALYDENITKEIYVPTFADNASLNEVVSISNVKDKTYTSETIECKKLDDIIIEENIQNIGFIKIDVQGFEYPVLKGMEQLLLGKKVPFMPDTFMKRKNILDPAYCY